jgi:glycosyltransferase involved in cell wall biosynthesis
MRVAHIITRLILGGAQENTLYTVEDLVAHYCDEVTLITGPAEGPEGSLLERANRRGIDVRLVAELCRSIRPVRDWLAYRRLLKLIRDLSPDVVHTHSAKAGILGRAAAFRQGVPAIVHTIHGLPFHPYERWWKNRMYIAAERWAARRCDRIIAVADAMVDGAVAAGLAPRDKFVTIYSGMEVEPFLAPARDRQSVRRELSLANDDLVVGKVARLFEFKGHDDVIDAAMLLTEKFPNLRFLFIGGGTSRARLETRVRALGLTERFRFTGLVPPERIPELIAACDVIAHASYREGLARVLPQALITGRPVVTYDLDGAREVVIPGETGFLVAPGDSASLARCLEKLLRDSPLRQQMGQLGRERFTDQFRHEHKTREIRRVYLEILAAKGRAPAASRES